MAVAAPEKITSGTDFYAPHFEVRMDRGSLAREVIHDIVQVSYRDSIEEIDSFQLTVNNWDAEKCQLKYSDEDLFDPGKKLELWMGYRGEGQMFRMIRGTIKSLQLTYPAGGSPQIAVSCLNVLDALRTKQVTDHYENLTDSRIASTRIATRLSIPIDTRPGIQEVAHEYLLQENKYDIVFLLERSRVLGYDLVVNEENAGPRLYFGPSQEIRRVTYELEYGKSLIQFTSTLNTANQVNSVIVRGADPVNKRKLEATVTRDQILVSGLSCRDRQQQLQGTFRQREEISSTPPPQTQQEAQFLAKNKLERIAKEFIKGSGSTIGLPHLRAGSFVEIKGIGRCFSGRYFVTSTTHTLGDAGYMTQFECRRE